MILCRDRLKSKTLNREELSRVKEERLLIQMCFKVHNLVPRKLTS